jgi:Cytochrome C and Quinol oxidase polypeptide I
MWGKLSWAAIPLDQPIPLVASSVVVLVLTGVLAWVILKGWFPYLWREWITSVDHKRIGIMYILLAVVMLLRGFTDAIMMRSQQALAFRSPGYLPPEHYDQIFSAHGTLMIFFVAMPFVIGLMNFVVPLQLDPRRRVSNAQLGRLLADRHRCAARQYFAARWRIRADRVAAVSTALRADLLPRCRRRLLPLVA